IARSSPASSFFGTHLFTLGPPACLLEVRRFFLRLRPIGLALRGGLLDLAFGRSPHSGRIIIPHHEPIARGRRFGQSRTRFLSPGLGSRNKKSRARLTKYSTAGEIGRAHV